MDADAARRTLAALHRAQGDFYAGGAAGPLEALLAEDIAWHVPGANAIAGDYVGRAAVMRYFARRRDLASGTFRMHPGELLIGDEGHVAVLTDGTAVLDGSDVRWSTLGLYRLRDALVAECWLLPLEPKAFDRIWSTAGAENRVPDRS